MLLLNVVRHSDTVLQITVGVTYQYHVLFIGNTFHQVYKHGDHYQQSRLVLEYIEISLRLFTGAAASNASLCYGDVHRGKHR